ncbi:MAG TPA: ATP synthase F1 subunit gamma [Bacteroidia bacterium]|jgi:F-type H+-transporting ATPase subunit gamma|nr:ATP synthase F1 subunit gamma [Bacteroidia bacterium]
MPSLKEVRNRISSTISTSQITSAMKMVSAAKLRKAQDAVMQMRPFAAKLKEILDNLISSGAGASVYSTERPVEKVLIVAITSNRGLCGGFNANVIKAINAIVRNDYAEQAKKGNVKIVGVGKKGSEILKKTNSMDSTHNELWDGLTYAKSATVAEELMKKYAAGEVDRVIVVYNQFKNAATQILKVEQLLPFTPEPIAKGEKVVTAKADYIFEPDKEKILQEIIPYALKVSFYRSLLDSNAAEHGARMTAMHKATDNAKELLRSLRLSYNKARQAAITKEILEIVAGAEAINN